MLYLSNKDRGNVFLILESLNKIISFTENIHNAMELYKDQKTFDDLLMNFVIIGETAGNLSEESIEL
jgi:uncharacterized protein with HEPN domain